MSTHTVNQDTDNGMDQDTFELFTEQLDRYITERLLPAEEQVIADNAIPEDILNEMRDLGLFGLSIDEEFGGAGMNSTQYLSTMERLSWVSPAYRSITAIGNGIVSSAISKKGTLAQKEQWLTAIAAGAVASFAITEPDSGSDAAALRCYARKEGNEYVINGTKRYITNAPFADLILLIARTSQDVIPKNGHISAFLLPTNSPGITIGKPDKKMGQQGSQIADVILEEVRVPATALLGEEEGTGFQAAMQSLNGGRLSVATAALGLAKRALDSGIRYARERKAFGEPISNFQLVQAKIADSQAEIYASECMLRDAASKLDQGMDIRKEAACVKMFISEACGRIVDRIVQIYGGAGYLQEYDAERFYRDARIFRIYEGTTEIMQLVIARAVLAEYNQMID